MIINGSDREVQEAYKKVLAESVQGEIKTLVFDIVGFKLEFNEDNNDPEYTDCYSDIKSALLSQAETFLYTTEEWLRDAAEVELEGSKEPVIQEWINGHFKMEDAKDILKDAKNLPSGLEVGIWRGPYEVIVFVTNSSEVKKIKQLVNTSPDASCTQLSKYIDTRSNSAIIGQSYS
jgi:hypothetical protein